MTQVVAAPGLAAIHKKLNTASTGLTRWHLAQAQVLSQVQSLSILVIHIMLPPPWHPYLNDVMNMTQGCQTSLAMSPGRCSTLNLMMQLSERNGLMAND